MPEDPSLADQFRAHFVGYGHLYGVLLDVLADDLEANGVTATICRDHLNAGRADVVHLRLLAGLQRIVLRGEAPELAALYARPDEAPNHPAAWRVLAPVLEAHAEDLHDALELAPQTNEVGRSACLLLGIFEAVRRHRMHRVRLFEPGASAGLNLNVDRYRFTGPDWSWGPQSRLLLDTQAPGVEVESFEIVERRGCDLAPVDASTSEGGRYLMSFVWPWDHGRRDRLAPALAVAREHPVTVDRARASEWLLARLSGPAPAGVLTIVWQSITRQYWPAAETVAVDRVVEDARGRMPISQITMEGIPPLHIAGGGGFRPELHGPDLRVDGDLIARSGFHGPPIFPLTGVS